MLIEGVPGPGQDAHHQTSAQCSAARSSASSSPPTSCLPTSSARASTGPPRARSTPSSGPVFTNFLLADEINRAPAKVQSALLEVMQELQVTIGNTTHKVERPFLVMATQNPIESEGTYPLPEAQVDRFMLKVLVDYPALEDEHTVAQRALAAPVEVRRVIELERLLALQEAVAQRLRRSRRRPLRRPSRIRHARPGAHGLGELAPYIAFGVSPRGPISMLHAARALAVLRGRNTSCPPTSTSSRPTRCVTASCSRTARSPRASAPRPSSPRLDKVPMPRVELVSEVA